MALTDWSFEESSDQGLYSGTRGTWKNKRTGETMMGEQTPQEYADALSRYESKYGRDFAPAYTQAEMRGFTDLVQRDVQITPTMRSRLSGINPATGQRESLMNVGQYDVGTSAQLALLAGTAIVGGAAFAPAAGGAAAGTSGAASEALMSTAATLGETVSTPALTTFAGPTGTGLLSTSVPTATLGVEAGLAAGFGGIELLDSGAAAKDIGASTDLFNVPSASRAATSSAASGLSGTDLLLAAQGAQMLMGLAAGGPEMPAGAAAQDMDQGPSTANKERAMELRRAAAERAANAAGSKRFENEVDLLGQTGRTTQRRRAGQQRVVLGY